MLLHAENKPPWTGPGLYLQQQLVLGDALDGFDERRGDGVGQTVSPLHLLKTTTRHHVNTRRATSFRTDLFTFISDSEGQAGGEEGRGAAAA